MNCGLMVIERNIKLFHTTLSSLDKPVCPISDQLVCSTDKTDVREEVSAALQNNHLLRSSLKERIESQNTIQLSERRTGEHDCNTSPCGTYGVPLSPPVKAII